MAVRLFFFFVGGSLWKAVVMEDWWLLEAGGYGRLVVMGLSYSSYGSYMSYMAHKTYNPPKTHKPHKAFQAS